MKNSENLEKSLKKISILNTTKIKAPKVPFEVLHDFILGKKYELSVAFVDPKTIQKINKKYRKKNKPTNVISVNLDEKNGEIILCPQIIKKETEIFKENFQNLTIILVIHAMLHLKGYEHGSKMNNIELRLQKKFLNKKNK